MKTSNCSPSIILVNVITNSFSHISLQNLIQSPECEMERILLAANAIKIMLNRYSKDTIEFKKNQSSVEFTKNYLPVTIIKEGAFLGLDSFNEYVFKVFMLYGDLENKLCKMGLKDNILIAQQIII